VILDLIHLTALIGVLATAVVYGTDAFCALVMRPALAAVDDDALVAVMGRVHRFGDRRMPLPGVLGVVAALATAVLAGIAGRWPQTAAAATATALLVVWIVLYTRISAPINRQLTAAADTGVSLANGRALQHTWDGVINLRATLQGAAVAALCLVLMV
jgi:hypothetical protein